LTIDAAAGLLNSATRLIGVLVWPLVVMYILVRFGPGLRDFITSLGEFTLKGLPLDDALRFIASEDIFWAIR
jgi:hypothetical protein